MKRHYVIICVMLLGWGCTIGGLAFTQSPSGMMIAACLLTTIFGAMAIGIQIWLIAMKKKALTASGKDAA